MIELSSASSKINVFLLSLSWLLLSSTCSKADLRVVARGRPYLFLSRLRQDGNFSSSKLIPAVLHKILPEYSSSSNLYWSLRSFAAEAPGCVGFVGIAGGNRILTSGLHKGQTTTVQGQTKLIEASHLPDSSGSRRAAQTAKLASLIKWKGLLCGRASAHFNLEPFYDSINTL